MCFSGTALRCMPGRSHSPGRGPGLTESASALRTSDAGLLPGSLCRSVADVGCWIVADAAVEVYGIGGSLLYSGKSHRVSVPVDGIYVVRVNGKPHKVVVK